MNKNWFYKVLALVLVAMLALPMFALAEETEEVVIAAEAPAEVVEDDEVVADDVEAAGEEAEDAEAGEVDLGEAVAKTWFEDAGIIYVDLASRHVPSYDIAIEDEGAVWQIVVENVKDGTDASLSFKSSNRKVAAVGDDGSIVLMKPGKVTITVRGYIPDKKSKVSAKFKLNVTDANRPSYMTMYVGPSDDADEFSDDTFASGKTVNVLVGEGWTQPLDEGIEASDFVPQMSDYAMVPYLYNADDGLIEEYPAGLTFKWSNAKVAFFDPRVDDAPNDKPYKAAGKIWPGETNLVPVFYKSGKSTLTVKAPAVSGAKAMNYKITFNVKANKVDHLVPYGDSYLQSLANKDGVILYAVDSIDIQTVDKVVVKMKVYNGTDWSASTLKNPRLLLVSNQGIAGQPGSIFTQYGIDGAYRNNKIKGSLKKKKTTTITFTMTNKRDKWFNLNNETARYTTEVVSPYQEFNLTEMAMIVADFGFDNLGQQYLQSVGAALGVEDVAYNE